MSSSVLFVRNDGQGTQFPRRDNNIIIIIIAIVYHFATSLCAKISTPPIITMVDNRGQCSTKSTAEDNRSDDDNYIKAGNSPTMHPSESSM
jgi:hypothetical protein